MHSDASGMHTHSLLWHKVRSQTPNHARAWSPYVQRAEAVVAELHLSPAEGAVWQLASRVVLCCALMLGKLPGSLLKLRLLQHRAQGCGAQVQHLHRRVVLCATGMRRMTLHTRCTINICTGWRLPTPCITPGSITQHRGAVTSTQAGSPSCSVN